MTTTEPNSYPDIEIYLKRVTAEAIIDWLKERFDGCTITKEAKRVTELEIQTQDTTIPVLLVEKAQGIFTSVLFESDQTPWQNDRACALEAFKRFEAEVRCNAEGWQEGAEPDEWLSISEEGETLINWPG